MSHPCAIIYIVKKLSKKGKAMSFMSYEWMIENEELMMFVIVPALMLPVGWVVTKILKTFEN